MCPYFQYFKQLITLFYSQSCGWCYKYISEIWNHSMKKNKLFTRTLHLYGTDVWTRVKHSQFQTLYNAHDARISFCMETILTHEILRPVCFRFSADYTRKPGVQVKGKYILMQNKKIWTHIRTVGYKRTQTPLWSLCLVLYKRAEQN